MGQFIDLIVASSKRSRGYGEKLVEGIKPEIFARKPRFKSAAGETVVDCNHPAFICGHLAIYPAKMITLTGGDVAAVKVPASYTDLFNQGVVCKDDPEGTIYPNRDEVLGHFLSSFDVLLAELAKVDDAVLFKQHPDEAARGRGMLTIGHSVSFMANNHVMMHLGQISTWRRCFGLPSAF